MTSMTQTITSLPTSSFMPEPEWQDSIDRPCGVLGKFYRCWTAKGPARALFEEIAGHIKTVLDSRRDDLDEGQIVPRTIGFSLYMISLRVLSTLSVRPTLLIECENTTVRNKAKFIVRESSIWRRTLREHHGLKLAASARGPQACGKEKSKQSEMPLGNDAMVYANRFFESACGIPISVNSDLHLRDATLGGIVIVDSVPMGITVAHAFIESTLAPDSPTLKGDDGFAFDSDDDLKENIASDSKDPGETHQACDIAFVILTYIFVAAGVASPPLSISYPQEGISHLYKSKNLYNTEMSPHAHRPTNETQDRHGMIELGHLHTSSAAFYHNALDWALFSINDRDFWKPNIIDLPVKTGSGRMTVTRIASKFDRLEDAEILAATSSCGALKGWLCGTPYYLRIGGSKTFQETWTVDLEAQID